MEKYKKLAEVTLTQMVGGNELISIEDSQKILSDTTIEGDPEKVLKAILSMHQQGIDVKHFHSEIIKASNTKDKTIKRLINFYLKNNFIDSVNQLLYINSFQKDLVDTNEKIKSLAILDCVKMSDEIVIQNYVRNLKVILEKDTDGMKNVVLSVCAQIYLKNREMFLENRFDRLIIACLENKKTQLNALRTLSQIEMYENILEEVKTIDLVEKYLAEQNTEALRYVVKILKQQVMRSVADKTVSNINLINLVPFNTMQKLLMFGDVCVFHYVGQILLTLHGEKYAQHIFDQAQGYLNLRKEQQYNVLQFMKELINKYDIKYNSNIFTIMCNDFLELKKIKFELFTKKMCEHSLGEIKNLIKHRELIPEIFELCIEKQIYLPGLLNFIKNTEKMQIISILLKNKKKFIEKNSLTYSNWNEDVEKFMNSFKKNNILPNQEHLLLEVASYTCSIMPKFVMKLKNTNDQLVMYYMKMYEHNYITKDQCINFLKIVKKENTSNTMTDFILSNAENLDYFMCDTMLIGKFNEIIFNTHPTNVVKYEKNVEKNMKKENNSDSDLGIDENALEKLSKFGNFNDSSDEGAPVELNHGFKQEHKQSIKKPSITINDSLSSESIDFVELKNISDFVFDLKEISGRIYFSGRKIMMDVNKLRREQTICVKINKKVETTKICTEGKKEIYDLIADEINKEMSVIVGDKIFSYVILLSDLMEENKMSLEEFNKQFEEIDAYEIIEKIEMKKEYFIDKNKFTFKLLKSSVLGKSFGTQYIIKGNENIIKTIKGIKEIN